MLLWNKFSSATEPQLKPIVHCIEHEICWNYKMRNFMGYSVVRNYFICTESCFGAFNWIVVFLMCVIIAIYVIMLILWQVWLT